MSIWSRYDCGDPSIHWLDLPEATDEEAEEESGGEPRKPVCAFTDRQTILVQRPAKIIYQWPLFGPRRDINVPEKLLEFPLSGDEFYLGGKARCYALSERDTAYGYILQRNPEFRRGYGWGYER